MHIQSTWNEFFCSKESKVKVEKQALPNIEDLGITVLIVRSGDFQKKITEWIFTANWVTCERKSSHIWTFKKMKSKTKGKSSYDIVYRQKRMVVPNVAMQHISVVVLLMLKFVLFLALHEYMVTCLYYNELFKVFWISRWVWECELELLLSFCWIRRWFGMLHDHNICSNSFHAGLNTKVSSMQYRFNSSATKTLIF